MVKTGGIIMDSGTIGEYYTLCEMWRNGLNAIKSESPREMDWDILVLTDDSLKTVAKIQVKAVNWISSTSKVISGDFNGDFDFLVIILLNYGTDSYTVYVIPKSIIKPRPQTQSRGLCDTAGNILYTNNTITLTSIGNYNNHLMHYKDNWSQI